MQILKYCITRSVRIGANIKIFSALSACFGAILKFRDKIYTPVIKIIFQCFLSQLLFYNIDWHYVDTATGLEEFFNKFNTLEDNF